MNQTENKKSGLLGSLISFGVLILSLSLGIVKYGVDPHIPMFIGVIGACVVSLCMGFKWEQIEKYLLDGINSAMQSCCILIIVGILIAVWIDSGVVPTMIYYGLQIMNPSFFFVACVIICSITSLATGTSWGTMGTIGVAMMGIGYGLGMNPAITAGAIISGAYFGDKMSPLSETTNLAPAMAGTDIMSHVKKMFLPSILVYVITLVFFLVVGLMQGNASGADMSSIVEFSHALNQKFGGVFVINPIFMLPPLVVIVMVALKMPAMPGITLGVIAGAVLGVLFQPGCTIGSILDFGMNGFSFSDGAVEILNSMVSEETRYTMSRLLENGGISGMMFSVSMTIIAMMYGGVMEGTGQLEAVVSRLIKLVKKPADLIAMTVLTCIGSNITMPEQYISIVVPGRMYAEEYKKVGLKPEVLSSTLEGGGTVTSALVPWNTCGVFIAGALGISAFQYAPYAVFNWLMPVVTIAMAYVTKPDMMVPDKTRAE